MNRWECFISTLAWRFNLVLIRFKLPQAAWTMLDASVDHIIDVDSYSQLLVRFCRIKSMDFINFYIVIFFFNRASQVALVVSNLSTNEGDPISIPRSGRSHGGAHDNPLQYSCHKNRHGQRSLMSYSPWFFYQGTHYWAGWLILTCLKKYTFQEKVIKSLLLPSRKTSWHFIINFLHCSSVIIK